MIHLQNPELIPRTKLSSLTPLSPFKHIATPICIIVNIGSCSRGAIMVAASVIILITALGLCFFILPMVMVMALVMAFVMALAIALAIIK